MCLFDCSESVLRVIGTSKRKHAALVTDAQANASGQPWLLQTSSTDGHVILWDLRTHDSAGQFSLGSHMPVGSCTFNNTSAAAGVGERVVLWDWRNAKHPTAVFEDTHAQDVVQIRFNPALPSALVSGSEDGNLAVFDISAVVDEVDSFVGALNLNTAVSKFGFYGKDNAQLWCTSGTETLHWWDWKGSCDPESTTGAGVMAESQSARQHILIGSEPSDYLISCHYRSSTDSMLVLAGDIQGSVVAYPCFANNKVIEFATTPDMTMTGGHVDIVRTSLVPSSASAGDEVPLMLTGGEDGRVCLWTCAPNEAGQKTNGSTGYKRASPY